MEPPADPRGQRPELTLFTSEDGVGIVSGVASNGWNYERLGHFRFAVDAIVKTSRLVLSGHLGCLWSTLDTWCPYATPNWARFIPEKAAAEYMLSSGYQSTEYLHGGNLLPPPVILAGGSLHERAHRFKQVTSFGDIAHQAFYSGSLPGRNNLKTTVTEETEKSLCGESSTIHHGLEFLLTTASCYVPGNVAYLAVLSPTELMQSEASAGYAKSAFYRTS
uniref:Uncharacterized protein n=1 Tax=Daphnia galeata TaxID=27404 RepID=A0A8J2WBK4_9CRUS|nr:unnamed protein product [Daphnia galeata]